MFFSRVLNKIFRQVKLGLIKDIVLFLFKVRILFRWMEEATLAVVDGVFFSGEKDERILVREAVAERIDKV